MEYTKILTVLTALATIAVGTVTVLTYLEDDTVENTTTLVETVPAQPTVILAKTTFNDSGYTYIIDFNGNILKMNNSISVISVVKGRNGDRD